MKNAPRLLQDMLNAIDSIEARKPAAYEQFLEDETGQAAILYYLIILGEAANQISRDLQEKHSEIPWSSIIGTRNIVIHGYDQVKYQIIWDILEKDLGNLKRMIAALLQEISK